MSIQSMKVPDPGEGVVEVELVAWHVRPGERVARDQHIVDLMTEKATVEITTPIAGLVLALFGNPGDRLAVGSELIRFDTGGEDAGNAMDTSPEQTAPPAGPRDSSPPREPPPASPPADLDPGDRAAPQTRLRTTPETRPLASPAVRRRAREARIDLARVAGTGRDGRVTHEDLDRHLAGARVATALAPDALVRQHKLVGLRRLVAQRMSQSHQQIPQFSYVEEVDITELESLRQQLNLSPVEEGIQLTYLPFILLALRRALPAFPRCNGHFDAASETFSEHGRIHVGIATQTERGLMVPVLRDLAAWDLWGLALELRRLAQGARAQTLKAGELTGSTITLSSLGRLGGLVSTPLVNPPEVAIVGVNRAQERVVARRDRFESRLMLNLSSSFDHRVLDGQDAAEFIQALKVSLEHPALLFMPAPSRPGD